MPIIEEFLSKVVRIYNGGNATEHSYRPALEALFNQLSEEVTAINEPKRVACGAPDFIFLRGEIPIGHVEAKDIDVGLRSMKDANKNQQERYRKALPNLIYTNCLDWDFYRNGERFASVTIADYLLGIQANTGQFEELENLLRDFIAQKPQTITSPRVLAEMMAGKAALIKDVLHNALKADEGQQTDLIGHYQAFRENLIHDLSETDFADIYAETIAYGMFAARLHDTTLDTFSRQKAQVLLPKSNPFLRSLFSYLSSTDLDDRVVWVIDDLAAVFQASNVAKLMEGFGKLTGQSDPFLHFYETFLAAYNPAKRKARGVWYTPEAVVNFIVRAVDEVLQTEFGLPMGLADTSKVTIDWDTEQTYNVKGGKKNEKSKNTAKVKKDVHRVQILDPATGTGTFLAEVIKQVAPKIKHIAPGKWSGYLEENLIPRLHGFELLMASYAMCHTKLDMVLTELGYKPGNTPPRLSVYLTNSLEEGDRDVRDLFMAQWLTREAKEANTIKRQTPIMCVIGNPPYAGESTNKGEWIMDLMTAYKKEPGGKIKLKERNPKWLNDDYVKFIRLAEHLIERTGEGVVGFITNHGYLSNPTFRGMRWRLLQSFDKIYVLDLHGNSKKKEVSPDGTADKNVFDIQPGVAIFIGVRNRERSAAQLQRNYTQLSPCRVFHAELWGERAKKYALLREATLQNHEWQELLPVAPQYDFIPRDYSLKAIYDDGFCLNIFMPLNSNGIVTARDALTIDTDKQELWQRVQKFAGMEAEDARVKFNLGKDVRDWTVRGAQSDLNDHFDESRLTAISYRPFDTCWTYYTGNSRGFLCYPRNDVMGHYLLGPNIGLLASKGVKDAHYAHVFVTPNISEAIFLSGTTGSNAMNFPLYRYPEDEMGNSERIVNFDCELFAKLKQQAEDMEHGEPDELAVFDYIYGVLHCPAYREKYAEFLKTNFPRIPWPESPSQFWGISAQGTRLRELHLMKPAIIGATPYPYTGEGDDVVGKARLDNGRIWINATQYFDTVPIHAWDFWIGGYQPAQKWLKDRKGNTLSLDDIVHYQRILKVLSETQKIMESIAA